MNNARAAIYARLAADSTLTGLLSAPTAIHHGVAPSSAAFPIIIFHRQSGTPAWQFARTHVQWDMWTVKGISRGSSASAAEDIAARIDTVLTDAPLVITGGVLLGVWRESDLGYVETNAGETYHHVGSLYRLASAPA